MRSFVARKVALVRGLRRYQDEEMGQFWRRLHRLGRRICEAHSCDAPPYQRAQVCWTLGSCGFFFASQEIASHKMRVVVEVPSTQMES